jgi:hypothetical protein
MAPDRNHYFLHAQGLLTSGEFEGRAEAPAKDRQSAARERAARERKQRMEAALEELTALQAEKKAEEKAAVRVSVTEPEARIMKHGDGAMAASYNAQITTEASHKIIVGAHLSQCSSDAQSLKPALEEVEKNLGEKPAQVVVDGGFTNRDNIVACAARIAWGAGINRSVVRKERKRGGPYRKSSSKCASQVRERLDSIAHELGRSEARITIIVELRGRGTAPSFPLDSGGQFVAKPARPLKENPPVHILARSRCVIHRQQVSVGLHTCREAF